MWSLMSRPFPSLTHPQQLLHPSLTLIFWITLTVQIIYRSFVRKLQASPHLGRPLAQLLPLLGYPRRLGHSRWPARLPSLGCPRRLGRTPAWAGSAGWPCLQPSAHNKKTKWVGPRELP